MHSAQSRSKGPFAHRTTDVNYRRIHLANSPSRACAPVQAVCAACIAQRSCNLQDMRSSKGTLRGWCVRTIPLAIYSPGVVVKVKYTMAQGMGKTDGDDQEAGLCLGTSVRKRSSSASRPALPIL